MAFVRVAAAAEIPVGAIKEFAVGGTVVALANVAGKIHAISNTCLHRGGPLGQGVLEGGVVTCPWHGWQFNVASGKTVHNAEAGVACYPVEVRGSEIFVEIAAA